VQRHRVLLPWSLLTLLMLLAACVPAGEIRTAEQVGEVATPRFRIVEGQTRLERFDPPGAGAAIAVAIGTSVINENEFPILLEEIQYQVSLRGKPVSRGSMRPGTYVEPGATTPVSWEFETSLADDPELLRAVVRSFTGEPLPFTVSGELTFNSAAFRFTTNRINLVEGELRPREAVVPPQLRLVEKESLAYLLNREMPVVRLVLSAHNPGDIGYFLYGKDLRLEVANVFVATDDLRPVPVPAGESTRVDILFYPKTHSLSEEGRAALNALLGGYPTLVSLSGTLGMDVLGVDAFRVPDEWSVVGFVTSPREEE